MEELSRRVVVAHPATEGIPDEHKRRLARIKRVIRRRTAGAIFELSVQCQGDAVTLRGRCGSFYSKQVAQVAAMHYLSDGERLQNDIEVMRALPVDESRRDS